MFVSRLIEGELLGWDCCDVSWCGEMGWEIVLLAATPFVLVPALFAAFVGWPSFLEVDSPVAAALPAATMVYAALSGGFGWLATMLIYARLSGGYVSLAATLFWAALSDGYGGDDCTSGLAPLLRR